MRATQEECPYLLFLYAESFYSCMWDVHKFRHWTLEIKTKEFIYTDISQHVCSLRTESIVNSASTKSTVTPILKSVLSAFRPHRFPLCGQSWCYCLILSVFQVTDFYEVCHKNSVRIRCLPPLSTFPAPKPLFCYSNSSMWCVIEHYLTIHVNIYHKLHIHQ